MVGTGEAEITARWQAIVATGSLTVKSQAEIRLHPPTRDPANVIPSSVMPMIMWVLTSTTGFFYETFQTTTSNDFEVNGDNILAYEKTSTL